MRAWDLETRQMVNVLRHVDSNVSARVMGVAGSSGRWITATRCLLTFPFFCGLTPSLSDVFVSAM